MSIGVLRKQVREIRNCKCGSMRFSSFDVWDPSLRCTRDSLRRRRSAPPIECRRRKKTARATRTGVPNDEKASNERFVWLLYTCNVSLASE